MSSLGEHVVELASPFSTAAGTLICARGCWLVDGTTVHVETVFVEGRVDDTDGLTDVVPVDFNVGVTVADGFVNAADLLSLSTRGLIGTVALTAAAPALCGSGSGRVDCCCCCDCGGGGGGCFSSSPDRGVKGSSVLTEDTAGCVAGKNPGISLLFNPPLGDMDVGVVAAPGDRL